MSLPQRFWAKVNKAGPVPAHRPDLGPCWIWKAEKNPKGYGLFRRGSHETRGPAKMAHRATYEESKGRIPKGKVPDHLCRVTSCVRPAHLEAVTPRVNTLRGVGPIAINARKTHCQHGHPLVGQNIYWCRGVYGPARECMTCKRRNRAKRYAETGA
jgi:hypothetical protein